MPRRYRTRLTGINICTFAGSRQARRSIAVIVYRTGGAMPRTYWRPTLASLARIVRVMSAGAPITKGE